MGKLFHCSNFCTVPSGWTYSSVSPYSTLYITVRLVGGGGVRVCVLRCEGPASGITPVSSPLASVLGGAFTGGGGGASAGGKLTRRVWALALGNNSAKRQASRVSTIPAFMAA